MSDGYTFVGMSCVLIHYPDGKVFKPFEMRENIYVEKPVFLDGNIYFLEVDFDKKIMSLIYIDSEELISDDFDEDKSIEDIKNMDKNYIAIKRQYCKRPIPISVLKNSMGR